jgi:hypothetical protein
MGGADGLARNRLPCQTAAVLSHAAAVLSHKDLWVIAGTTAPVVGLAAIVSLTDALRENGDSINAGVRIQLDDIEEHYRAVDIAIKTAGDIQAAMDSPYPNHDRADQLMNDSRKWALRLFAVGALNLIVQAALLAVSLVSIADDTDLVPTPYAIAAAVGGLVLLTVSAFGALYLRLERGSTERLVQR